MKRVLKNKWFYILLLVLAGGWWWLYGTSSDSKHADNNVLVTTAPVTRRDVPVQVPLVGSVVAYETVAIKSRLDSLITGVFFHDGDYVQEGQKLFELDDRTIKADISQMTAALEKEKAQLINAKLQYQRSQKLLQSHIVAQAQADVDKANYEAQVAQVNAAEANLANSRVQLTYTVITAPISGRTGTINITRGNNVKANDTIALVTINQISPIRVQFAIPQRYYEQVRATMTDDHAAVVTAQQKDAQDIATGTLEYLDNSIDVTNGTFAARAVFANTDEKLWPGMFVNVVLNLGEHKDALTVPLVAVQGDENKHFVFVAKDNKAVRTPVEIIDSDDTIAIIGKGLNEGDQVIVDGILRLNDGTAITPSAADDKVPAPESPHS